MEIAIYAYDPDLEVEMEIISDLDDEWFEAPILDDAEDTPDKPWFGERLLCHFVFRQPLTLCDA